MSILAIVVTKMQHKSCQCDDKDTHTVPAAAALFATANEIRGWDTLSTLCAASGLFAESGLCASF